MSTGIIPLLDVYRELELDVLIHFRPSSYHRANARIAQADRIGRPRTWPFGLADAVVWGESTAMAGTALVEGPFLSTPKASG